MVVFVFVLFFLVANELAKPDPMATDNPTISQPTGCN